MSIGAHERLNDARWRVDARTGLWLPRSARDRMVVGHVAFLVADPIPGTPPDEWRWEPAGETHNLYLNDGYGRLAAFLAATTPAPPSYIAVGNGDGSTNGITVSPLGYDHQLGFELQRNAITSASQQNTYTARLATIFQAADLLVGSLSTRRITEIGLFDTAGDKGTATSATTNTLTDSTKAWTVNAWANFTVYITGGTGSGQSRTISSNTATALTVGTVWTTTPDATSTYTIGGVGTGKYCFARASCAVTKGRQAMNCIWSLTLPVNS